MFSFLKDHPFAVEAFFESSLVLTFAFPKEQLEHYIPECLELDTFNDKWAFVAVAMVQTTGLRPKGFPKILGRNFFLIGYRIFVRYTTNAGKRLRGLYILRSETDKKMMKILGNTFTHYHYQTTDIYQKTIGDYKTIASQKSNFSITVAQHSSEEISLPEHSPFSNWKEARRYAGPLPFTFTYTPESKKVLIIEGVRQNWKPTPVKVHQVQVSFLKGVGLNENSLANAFIIHQIPYYWKKGRVELWRP